MIIEKLVQPTLHTNANAATSGSAPRSIARRNFMVTAVGGVIGLAFAPVINLAQQKNPPKPGQRPTEQPSAFVTITPNGTVTVLCNRMDMGQGIETALAMICAEELDVQWSNVRSGFGDERPNYTDPMLGLHITGGSNSVKNSYIQYRELGARTKSMLIAAAAQRWNVSAANVHAEQGVLRSGNRSLSYGDMFADAMKQPIPEQVTLKDPKSFKLIGKPTNLLVARNKSTGQQGYSMDIRLPGQRVAVVLRPPVFGARYKSFDDTKARRIKGVLAVLPVDLDRGARGLAVVATGYWPAQQARNALTIEWDTSGVEKADTTAMRTQYLELAKKTGALAPDEHFRNDLVRLGNSPRKLSAEFVFPYLNHAQMEPLACTVDLKAGRCDVYTASQVPGVDAAAVIKSTGLPADAVHIHVQMGGGGFGRRAVPTSDYVFEAVSVAKSMAAAGQRAPVKVIHSREDDMRGGYYRPFTVHRVEIGYDTQGNVLGWDHRIVSQSILLGSPFEAFAVKDGVDGTSTEGLHEQYELPMRLTVHHPKVNVPVLWWRSVGHTHNAYVIETLVDEIAQASNQDPVAYRLKLMGNDSKHTRHRAALQLAAQKAGYGTKPLPAGMQWGVAVHESFESVVAYVLQAGVRDGRVVIGEVTAGVHCNLCINPRTVETQVQGCAVMALTTTMPGAAITLKDGVVEQSNFGDYTVARINDAPRVAVHVVPSSDPPKGMGEVGLPPFAPALANALRRATGRAQRELPFQLT
jgi:isoquinoline 1-oxidoreductase subunit beta